MSLQIAQFVNLLKKVKQVKELSVTPMPNHSPLFFPFFKGLEGLKCLRLYLLGGF